MMKGYERFYLNKVSKKLGNMLHDAVYGYGYDGGEFLQQFIQSKIAAEIERGNPKYIAGKSGIEILLEVRERVTGSEPQYLLVEKYDRSDMYWIGWILAKYQWHSGRSFKDILNVIPFDDLLVLYRTLHEEDERKSYEVFERRFENQKTNLSRIRKMRNITQEELAEVSGVSVNTIRAYERKSKDIGKAQVDILIKLSNGLKCTIEDIL